MGGAVVPAVDLGAVDEDALGARVHIERVAGPDDHVAVESRLQGADAVVQSQERGRVHGQGLQRRLPGQPLLHGERRLVHQEVDRDDGVVGRDRDADASCGDLREVADGAVAQLDLGARGEHRPEDHGDVALGEHVRDLVALGAVVDDEPVAELVGEADGGRDVVVAVGVLVPDQLAVEHPHQGLLGEVARERLALALGVVALGAVVLRLDEGLADDHGDAEPRARGLVLAAVDPLGVLAERRLHAHGGADDLLVDRAPAPALQRDRLAADRVAGARLDDDRGHAACERVAEALVVDVHGIDRADGRGVRSRHLVGVVPGGAVRLLVDADVAVRLDEAREDPLACGVEDGHALWDGDLGRGPDGGDPAVLDEDGPVLDGLPRDGDDVGADDGDAGCGHGVEPTLAPVPGMRPGALRCPLA